MPRKKKIEIDTSKFWTGLELKQYEIQKMHDEVRKTMKEIPIVLPYDFCSFCHTRLVFYKDKWECLYCRCYWNDPIKIGDKAEGIINDYPTTKYDKFDDKE